MIRRFFLVSILLTVLVAAGFFPWKVTAPAQGLLRRFVRAPGWQLTLTQARWVPWSHLEMSDLKIVSPTGGRLHLVKVNFKPRLWTRALGGWVSRWEFGEIRMDPGSWRIRRPLAQELISAGPVTTSGFALLEMRSPAKRTLEQLVLHGPLLRVRANGSLTDTGRVELDLSGELPRLLLEGMRLGPTDQIDPPEWEPFELKVTGTLPAPAVEFNSSFLKFALGEMRR